MKRFLMSVMAVAAITATIMAQSKVELGAFMNVGVGCVTNLPGYSSQRLMYKIGGSVDIPLARKFSVEPILRFSHSSNNIDGYYGSEQIMRAKYRLSMGYVEMPVLAAWKLPILGGKAKLLIKYGPYVAYGIKGKAHVYMPDTDYSETMSGSLFDGGCDFYGMAQDINKKKFVLPDFKRWDYGLTSEWGLEINRVQVGIDYSVGFANLTHKITERNPALVLLNKAFFGNGSGKPRRIDVSLKVGYRF